MVPARPAAQVNARRRRDRSDAFVGTNVFVLFDTSNYMYRGFVYASDAIADFVRGLDRADSVAVYTYSRNLSRAAPLTQGAQRRHLRPAQSRRRRRFGALQRLLLTLRDAAKVPGRKVVIVFSNGPDNASMVAPDDVRAVAEDEGIPIYVISTNEVNKDPISSTVFKRISTRTGGKSYFAKTWQKQVEAFENIREDLGNSYTVTYYPQPNPNEGFRKINVEMPSDVGKKYRVQAAPAIVRAAVSRTRFAMAWQKIKLRSGTWLLEPEQLRLLLERHASANMLMPNTRVFTTSERGYNPLSWMAPDTQHVETDFALIRAKAPGMAQAELPTWLQRIQENPEKASKDLADLMAEMRAKHKALGKLSATVSRQSEAATDRYLSELETTTEVLKVSRDLCFGGVLVCATMMTGPAILVTAAVGSVLVGGADYEDNHNVESAVVTTVLSLVTVVIPIKGTRFLAKVPRALASRFTSLGDETVGLKIVHASLDGVATATESLEHGEDFKTAAKRGAVAFSLDFVDIKKLPKGIPKPVKVAIRTNGGHIATETVKETTIEKVTELIKQEKTVKPVAYAPPGEIDPLDFVHQFVLRAGPPGR